MEGYPLRQANATLMVFDYWGGRDRALPELTGSSFVFELFQNAAKHGNDLLAHNLALAEL